MKFDDVRAAIINRLLEMDGPSDTTAYADVAGILAEASRDKPE